MPLMPQAAYCARAGCSLSSRLFQVDPENNSDLFLSRMSQQFRHVDVGVDGEDIAELIPPFVQNDIFEAIFGGEIDVIFVGGSIEAGLEIDVIEVERVPPVPGYLARLDPACFLQLFGP